LNLSYPPEKSVNDFIDKEYCTVRYSSIDDAVRMVHGCCQKCAFSQFLNHSNGIVYAGISDSTILFVNKIVYRFLWGI
jgi:hypothetical protein